MQPAMQTPYVTMESPRAQVYVGVPVAAPPTAVVATAPPMYPYGYPASQGPINV
jgi:hypothetical protein